MRPYYFDFEAGRNRRAALIVAFERGWRGASPPRPAPRRGLRHWRRVALALLRLWHRRVCERRDLARLDARMLRDIGVTAAEAARECDKPFWRA